MSMTQEEVNEAFEETKKAFKQLEIDSGKSSVMFLISKECTQFLGQFELIREQVLESGLEIGVLSEKITVTIN